MRIQLPKTPARKPKPRGTATEWGNSRWSTLESCPRAYFHNYIEQIVPAEPNPSLDRGTAFHAGIAAFYAGASLKEIEEAVATNAELEKSRYAAIQMIHAYMLFYRAEKVRVLGVEVLHEVEIEFVAWPDAPVEKFTLTTQYDAVVNTQDGVRWFEHKSAGELRASRMRRYEHDGQLCQGCAIWFHGGPPTSKLRVPRGLKLPKSLIPRINVVTPLGDGAYEDLTPDSHLNAHLRESLSKHFHREDFFYAEGDFMELFRARARQRRMLHELAEAPLGKSAEGWPQHMSSCFGTYGACDYFDLCNSRGSARELYRPAERGAGGDGGGRL